MTETPSVPKAYHGLWRREYLVMDGQWDTQTQVYWLQTGSLYVDIRIPPERPSFVGITDLAQCSREQRCWLAHQQGFAGHLQVHGDTLHWVRNIDYQPPGVADIGRVEFCGDDVLIETGVLAEYEERWCRVDNVDGQWAALVLEGERRGILVISGDYFLAAFERAVPLPKGTVHLSDDLDGLSPETAVDVLDCEISLGRVSGGRIPWEIFLSTVPFRESHQLFQDSGALQSNNNETSADGSIQHWRMVECSSRFSW